MDPKAKPATPRVRHVLGRREIAIDGKPVRFELQADGLHVRRKHTRKERVLPFADLWATACGQALLKL